MGKKARKIVNLNEPQYEILVDYAESKGITLGEAIQEMQKDINFLKSQTLTSISDNAILLCDSFDALTEAAKIPQWLKDAIITTMRPIILQGMLNGKDIDLSKFKESWEIPQGMRLIIPGFDKE